MYNVQRIENLGFLFFRFLRHYPATMFSDVPSTVFVTLWKHPKFYNILLWDDWVSLKLVSRELSCAIGPLDTLLMERLIAKYPKLFGPWFKRCGPKSVHHCNINLNKLDYVLDRASNFPQRRFKGNYKRYLNVFTNRGLYKSQIQHTFFTDLYTLKLLMDLMEYSKTNFDIHRVDQRLAVPVSVWVFYMCYEYIYDFIRIDGHIIRKDHEFIKSLSQSLDVNLPLINIENSFSSVIPKCLKRATIDIIHKLRQVCRELGK
jgi:hypothetical protein